MNKKILITGASGFIGYNIFHHLKKKNLNVAGLDNFKVKNSNIDYKTKKKIIYCDILNKKKLKKILKQYDIIIHLAAIEDQKYISKCPDKAFDVNFTGTKNIIDSLKKDQLIIFFSSNLVYCKNSRLINEKSLTQPNEIYGISKLLSENYIKLKSKLEKFNFFIIRNFTTFGPYQTQKSYIPSLINLALKKKKIDIWNPKKYRDLQYVGDLCENIFQLISNLKKINKNLVLNAASGIAHSPLFIAKTLANLIDRKILITCPKIKNLRDSRKLVSILNFKKILKNKYKVSDFKKSLLKTLKFYKTIG